MGDLRMRIDGTVHDRSGTAAMLTNRALLSATGFAILLITPRVLGTGRARAVVAAI
jgi:hypothetical protein